MTVYHGGAQIVANPDLLHSRKAVDFGAGFYVTPILEQARRWCEKRKRATGEAAISRYVFTETDASRLKVLRFRAYSEEWLDFIVNCRGLQDDSDWDIVIGGVANDKVFDTLEAYFDGFATKAQTIGKLQMATPNLQICFRTEAALQTIRFIGGEMV
jgi:hypothetical protein